MIRFLHLILILTLVALQPTTWAQTCEVVVTCDGIPVSSTPLVFGMDAVCDTPPPSDTGGPGGPGPDDTAGPPAATADTATDTADTAIEEPSFAERYQRILILNYDDLGSGSLEVQTGYSHPNPIAPTLDGLAATGIRMARAYAAPNCSPSRAQLFTGRIAARDNVHDVAWPINVEATLNSWVHAFDAAGYATWAGGKTHVDGVFSNPALPVLPGPRSPSAFGFQTWDATVSWYEGGTSLFSTEGANHPPPTQADLAWYTGDETGALRLVGGPQDPRNGSEVLLDDAIAFFQANPTKSVAYVGLGDAHTPYTAQLDDYDPAWGSYVTAKEGQGYLAEVRQADNAIASRLPMMDALGLLDGTLILITSDNGAREWSGFQAYPNGPLYGYKTDVYEGGIRVPTIFWATDMQPGVVDAVVSHLDLGSTLTELFGVPFTPPIPIDGESFAPALLGDPWQRSRDLVIIGPSQEHVAGAVQDYALIDRGGCFKLERVDGVDRLVDLCTDPGGYTDVSASFPAVSAALSAQLDVEIALVEQDALDCADYPSGNCGPQPPPRRRWTDIADYDGIRSTVCPSFAQANAGWNKVSSGCR